MFILIQLGPLYVMKVSPYALNKSADMVINWL